MKAKNLERQTEHLDDFWMVWSDLPPIWIGGAVLDEDLDDLNQ